MKQVAWIVMFAGVAWGGQAQAQQTQPTTTGASTTANAASTLQSLEAQVTNMKAQMDDWADLSRYRDADMALPAHQPGRVVFYGDSITDAWVKDGGKFFPGKPYINRGISGQTTPQMLVRMRQDVVQLHPETVVILAGTNDIAGNTGPSTPEMIENNFKSMTEIAKANGIRVILASVLPVKVYPWRPSVTDPAGKIKALNAWIKGYCAKKGCTYLDYWSAMAAPDGGMKPGISIDGVHPNAAGYAIMEPLAEAALAKK
ncbi:MAG: capsular biosynthesis protein [Acidobacteria bacterium]|nr:capsular biosynthesis protein [Acidobacteriota bacterium]